jgi:iron complex outermembrane receptor protein
MRYPFLLSAAAVAISPVLVPNIAWADNAPPPATPQPAPASSGQEIVVTASPFAHQRDDTPAIVAKVDAEEVLKSGGANIADALKNVPGVSSTGFAAGASRPIIRGMDALRVRMLEDGTSSSDVSDVGPDHGVPIDPLAARSIEIVRGAGTLRYGSQAIGGVVNVINDRVPMKLPDQPLSGELTGAYGSVADSWEGSGLIDAKVGDFAIHADGSYRHAGDYDTPLGTQANSFARAHAESAGSSYFFGGGDSHVGLGVTQFNADYGIPSDITHIVMKQTKLITRDVFALGDGLLSKLTFDGSYADYQHQEVEPDGTVDTTFKNKEYDARTELVLGKAGPLANSAIGVEYQHRAFSAIGQDASYLFPTITETVAGYAFADVQLAEKLHVEASGRVEHVSISGTPASNVFTQRSFAPVSGAVGALYEVSPAVKLGVTFASTGRSPAITELFARGGHDGPNTYETGDPTLKIERANSLEASLRLRLDRFRFDGSIYSSWFRNYIYGDLTGRTCDDDGVCTNSPDGELKELFYRQQGAHFRGLEGEAHYAAIRSGAGTLDLHLLGDLTRATLDDGSNVPRIPPWRIGGGAEWKSDRWDAGFTLIHAGAQKDYGAFDTATPGYNDLSANISWRPFQAHKGFELSLIGQNLTDDVQRDAASLNKDQVVAPGRSVRLVVKLAG